LLLRISTERMLLRFNKMGRKDAERRDKESIRTGKNISPGMAGESFRRACDVTNDAAGL